MARDDRMLRRARCSAQRLDGTRRSSVTDVVDHLVGVQAQVASEAALAVGVRSRGLSRHDVDHARLEESSIVLTWAMRGTLHLVTAETYLRFIPLLLETLIPRSTKRLAQEGIPEHRHERALALVVDAVTRGGPMSGAEIAERLAKRGIRTRGQAMAHLLWLAAARRGVVRGGDRDGRPTFLLARDWLGAAPPEIDREERDAIAADLAIRYLRSHAPATPQDLAAWSGLGLRQARAAWSAIARRLVEVRTPSGPAWSPRRMPRPRGPALLRALPAFDEYLLGWRDRSFALEPRHARRVNAGGGWLRPVVVQDGRVIATWRRDREGNPELEPFDGAGPRVRDAFEVEAARIATFVRGTARRRRSP